MKDLLERHFLNLANIVASPANPRAATSNRDFAFDCAGNVIDGAHRVNAVNHKKKVDRALHVWAHTTLTALPDEIRSLIRGANWSLYCGPITAEDAANEGIENWPGFPRACAKIRDALNEIRELWIDAESETWETVEPQEDLDIYWKIERAELLEALVGRELVEYVR